MNLAKKHSVHEPLFHITKRTDVNSKKSLLIYSVSVLCALIVCAVFIVLITGKSPFEIFTAMYEGSFGGEVTQLFSFHSVAILLCISLAVTPAFKMRFWNIGAEGQILVGGMATAYCMLTYGDTLDEFPLIMLMLASAILAGIVWAIIPAIFKAIWNTNETLFTLMMNYVAIELTLLFLKVMDKSGHSNLGRINERTEYGYLPKLFGQDYIFNIVIVAALTVIMFIYLKYSKHGYELSVVGESENTARYIGINVKKVIIRTIALSGAICGLVGFMIVSGEQHSFSTELAGGQGFTAILVSWMAKFNPIVMVLVSGLVVFLRDGGKSATSAFKVDNSFGNILMAIIILFILIAEFFINYRINIRSSKKGEK